jgi:hypothetical protein
MSKLAFLICTHDHPDHLGRLVRRLRHPDSSFFIFVDGKVRVEPFAAAVRGEPRCHFVARRHPVFWMGFSAVEAQLALLRAALGSGERFKYYVFLTGTDYPLVSAEAIHRFYEEHSSEFLKYFLLDENADWAHKVSRHYLLDVPCLNRREVFRTGTRAVLWLPALALGRLVSAVVPRRARLDGFTLCGGSAHWSLTHACVVHLLEVTAREPRVAEFFRRTHSPDEMYFHTLVANSPYRDNVVNRTAVVPWPANRISRHVTEYGDDLKYIDWNGSRESPAILDGRDLAALQRSGKLFARKFHPQRSGSLLDSLDALESPAARAVSAAG